MTDVIQTLTPEAARGDRYWAGGSKRRWFVMLHYQPRWFPDDEATDYEVESFPVEVYGSEAQASRAAFEVADIMNVRIGYVLEK
ncbi:hypothetical protein CcrColossus_gp419 [Caulobacter phage CcrColossus]|uniref:Uncharacterized protein n=1 Tax=Caulobacter phage CcrColossus TaxID=1211640 RepID=K4JSG3_9CAUD|nr:hypothetical protein CcrColossus_gp419 [Caulobacter phage CcrColossus]AFU88289.1 hypothetical protein CcrColossus_gp419 [Caulobacter phage CcrColossus]